jgi:hypothetical protein
MAMSFLKLHFLTLAMETHGGPKTCAHHTDARTHTYTNIHTHATDQQPTLHSTSKPQRVKYHQSSLTMLSGRCQQRADGGTQIMA